MAYPVNIDEGAYDTQRAEALRRYQTDLAANNFQTDLTRQNLARKKQDLGLAFTTQRNSFNTPFLSRGMFNSGLRQEALNQMAMSQTNQQSDLGLQGQQQEFDASQKGATLGNTYQDTLRQIATARTSDINSQAAQLQNIATPAANQQQWNDFTAGTQRALTDPAYAQQLANFFRAPITGPGGVQFRPQ